MERGIKELLYRISWIFIPYMIILIICLIIKASFSKEDIYFAINDRHNIIGDFIAPFFTDLGEGLTIVILSMIIFVFFSMRKGLLLLTSYALTGLFAQLIKRIFDAPRPVLYFKASTHHLYFVKGVQILSLHSFPSGHTVTAFSAAVVLTYCCVNKKWGIVFLLLAILVGLSRVYLSEHFFEDVFAGSVIGFYATVLWLLWLDSRKFIHTPKWNGSLLRVKTH